MTFRGKSRGEPKGKSRGGKPKGKYRDKSRQNRLEKSRGKHRGKSRGRTGWVTFRPFLAPKRHKVSSGFYFRKKCKIYFERFPNGFQRY